MNSNKEEQIDALLWMLKTKDKPDGTIEQYRENIKILIEDAVDQTKSDILSEHWLAKFSSIIYSANPEELKKKRELLCYENSQLFELKNIRKLLAHWKYENIVLINALFWVHGASSKDFEELESIMCWAHPENLKLIIEKWDIIEGWAINIDKLQKLENLMISAYPQNLEITLDAGITHTQSLLDLDYPLSQVTPENFKKIAESFEVAKVFKK